MAFVNFDITISLYVVMPSFVSQWNPRDILVILEYNGVIMGNVHERS